MRDLIKLIIVCSASFIVGAGLFFMTGWLSAPIGIIEDPLEVDKVAAVDWMLRDNLALFDPRFDLSKVNRDNFRAKLREISAQAHLAGQSRDEYLAISIRDEWQEYVDEVSLQGYEMLLSYPDRDNPNSIKIFDDNDEEIFSAKIIEDGIPPNFTHAFLAYAPKGKVTRNSIVYVNFARLEDFDLLLTDASYPDVKDQICLARYGEIFRGNQEENARNYGCAALIIFSDPEQVAPLGVDHVYPENFCLPGSGMQRGTLFNLEGDPATPDYPSLPGTYRVTGEELNSTLPQIPCQPIGYHDAALIFDQMSNNAALPEGWKGGIVDAEYTLGGKLKNENYSVTIDIHNNNEFRTSSNVIGVIRGEVEPDRYVMFGNHRDAWGYGSVDPGSGTSQLLEVVRILGEKVKTEQWRPRRTLVFCSWGAEEHGLLGSREFNEDFLPKLSDRTVAYINTDICVSGSILKPSATPSIRHMLLEATKNVPDPEDPSQSYYNRWLQWTQEGGSAEEPKIGLPGAGSDHSSFIFLTGAAALDIAFKMDYHKYPVFEHTAYPTYHTGFETFDLMDDILDGNFDYGYHKLCADLNLLLARQLSDVVLLDLRPDEYAALMTEAKDEVIQELAAYNVDVDYWQDEIANFELVARDFRARLNAFNVTANPDPAYIRALNDQMMKMDRAFLSPAGLPDRILYKHLIISPSLHNSYGGGVFPGIGDLLYGIEHLNATDLNSRVEDLNRHVSDLRLVIKAAADILKDFPNF